MSKLDTVDKQALLMAIDLVSNAHAYAKTAHHNAERAMSQAALALAKLNAIKRRVRDADADKSIDTP